MTWRVAAVLPLAGLVALLVFREPRAVLIAVSLVSIYQSTQLVRQARELEETRAWAESLAARATLMVRCGECDGSVVLARRPRPGQRLPWPEGWQMVGSSPRCPECLARKS